MGKFSGFKLAVILTVFVAVFFMTLSHKFTFLEFIELKTLDMRFKIRGEMASSQDVGIAVIDDQSIEALGRWPWPRSYFGALIDSLAADGAKVIGFDIIYSEPEINTIRVNLIRLKSLYDVKGVSRLGPAGREFGDILTQVVDELPDSDQILADAMERHGSVISTLVFHSFEDDAEGETAEAEGGDLPPAELLEETGEGGDQPPAELFEETVEGGDLPPAELLEDTGEGGDQPPAELMEEEGWEGMPDDEGYAQDAFIPDKVRQEEYRNIIGDGPMFDVPRAGGLLLPIDKFVDVSDGFGFVNFHPEIDGGLRWENTAIEYLDRYYPSIAIRMMMEYYGLGQDDLAIVKGEGIRLGDISIPTDDKARMLVNYYGPYGSMQYYSIVDIIEGNYPPGTFQDKIILVGGAATGLGDVWLTPFDPSLPGVEKHATVISNILQGDFIKRPPSARMISLLLIVAVGFALGFFIPRLPSVLHVLLFTSTTLAVLFGVVVITFTAFGIWVNLIYPLLSLLIVSVGVVVYQYFTEEREKRQIKKAFKMYLNDALVEQLAESHDGLQLGGDEKVLTVLFSDIRNFTSISEGMTPEQLVSLINTYLSLMTKTIMNENGTVDKYIGDAIMAIYGAPVYSEEHPAQACRAALKMMYDLDQVRGQWKERGYPEITIGIGINTGRMVVGNMGSEDRFDYTVMGDSVNLASRLEGLTKAYGAGIIVSEFTEEKLSGFVHKDLDLVRVKGKDKPIRIFELLAEGTPDKAMELELEQYSEALELYRKMHWDKALDAFKALEKEHNVLLYNIYGKRCAAFKENPPEGDWDGVFTFTTK